MPYHTHIHFPTCTHTLPSTASPSAEAGQGPSHISRYPSWRGNQKPLQVRESKAYKKPEKTRTKSSQFATRLASALQPLLALTASF
eukprot:3588674-Prymnesium_polylepis.1